MPTSSQLLPPKPSPEALRGAQQVFSWLSAAVALSLSSLALGAIVETESETFASVVLFLAGFFYLVALALLVVVGYSLGRFGFKYAVPPLFFPFVGFAFSYLRLRYHIKRTRLPSSEA